MNKLTVAFNKETKNGNFFFKLVSKTADQEGKVFSKQGRSLTFYGFMPNDLPKEVVKEGIEYTVTKDSEGVITGLELTAMGEIAQCEVVYNDFERVDDKTGEIDIIQLKYFNVLEF
jgi:hypothetical protein